MPDYSKFHAVFPLEGQKPYDANGVREIETYRKTFHGVLFIDRVLKALGIGEGSPSLSRLPTRSVGVHLCIPANLPAPPLGKIYPPKGENGLRSLHQQVCESKVSAHHKLSVLYYLLLDHDAVRGSRSSLAEELSSDSALPSKYQILMKGLWHMDHQQFNVCSSSLLFCAPRS